MFVVLVVHGRVAEWPIAPDCEKSQRSGESQNGKVGEFREALLG